MNKEEVEALKKAGQALVDYAETLPLRITKGEVLKPFVLKAAKTMSARAISRELATRGVQYSAASVAKQLREK